MSGFHANLLPHKLHDVLKENTLRGNVECVHTDSKPTDRNHAVHVHLTTEQPNQSSSGKNINTTDGTVLQKKKTDLDGSVQVEGSLFVPLADLLKMPCRRDFLSEKKVLIKAKNRYLSGEDLRNL